MKMMNAALLFNAVAAAVVAARMQVALNGFANATIFELNFVAEADGVVDGGILRSLVGKVPLKNCQRLFGAERHDDVDGDVVGIAVEHPVRKNPIIFGA